MSENESNAVGFVVCMWLIGVVLIGVGYGVGAMGATLIVTSLLLGWGMG